MPQDYSDYNSSGSSGGLGDALEPVLSALKQYWAVLLVVALLAGGALFYVYVFPKNSAVTVIVKVMDDPAGFDGAQVLLRSINGKNLVRSKNSDFGRAVFEGVPAGKAVLVVDAQPPFEPYEEEVEVPSGAEKTFSVQLSKSTKLVFLETDIPSEFSPSCSRKVAFSVFNNGTADEQFWLVADGTLGDFLEFPKEAVSIASGGRETVAAGLIVSASAEEGGIDGGIRIKGTSAELGKKFSVRKIDVAVSPESINYNSKEEFKDFLVITNNGGNTVSGISYKFNSGSRECASCVSVAAFGETRLDKISILPKDSARLQIEVSPPSVAGKYLGELVVQAGCFSKSIPVAIDIPAEQQ
ncbi:hypothetical protein HY993_04535 [Candidatus Micrarchaeota archaeon]|nr:hypothetical protein [Candidatus Micrarchaeota archaeon]